MHPNTRKMINVDINNLPLFWNNVNNKTAGMGREKPRGGDTHKVYSDYLCPFVC